MGAEWPRFQLGAVVEYITVGHVGPMAHEYVDDGVPFLRSQNVTPRGLDPTALRFISPGFHSQLGKSALQTGDVVVVRTGRPGTAAVVGAAFDGANCADLVIIRPGKLVHPRFLAGFINSVARGHIAAHLVGAVQQHFNVGSARTIELGLPCPDEQAAIADVLGALDDKIESNRRLGSCASDVVEASFADLAARATERVPLGEIAAVVKATTLPARSPNGVFEQFSIPAFDDANGPEVCVGSSMASAKTLMPEEVVLLSKLNPATKRVWWPERLGIGRAVCSPEFVALAPSRSSAAWIYACAAFDSVFYGQILGAVSGTTGSRQRVKLSDVLAATVPAPCVDDGAAWDRLARLLLDRNVALLRESRALIAMRDALLPKLVSGQIRVPLSDDVEEQLGAAIEALA